MLGRWFVATLLVLSMVGVQGLAPRGSADDKTTKKTDDKKDDKKDAKKDDKKDEDKPKEKKLGGVKRSQVRGLQPVRGKITGIDETSFTLEVGMGQVKKSLDITIAEDAIVRVPPQKDFDDKGRPKQFKRDPTDKHANLGGVKGSREDLRDGQLVAVQVGKYQKKLVATTIVVMTEPK